MTYAEAVTLSLVVLLVVMAWVLALVHPKDVP